MIERLDGFTADGLGNVIDGDPQDGDVVRIDGKTECRYYAPVEPKSAPEKPATVSKQLTQDDLTALNNALAVIQKILTP